MGERPGYEAVIHRCGEGKNLLTFAELMELHFIRLFRNEGVSLQTIRKAANAAAKKFGTKHPFAAKRFDTDGRTVFATLTDAEREGEAVEDLKRGQLVFDQIIKPFFKKLDYGDRQEIERFWPLSKSGRIVLDPMRRFGQPIDAATGIPVDTIIDALNAGGGQDPAAVAAWLDVPLEAVNAALKFQHAIAA
jgi:uncharacterized protein (DUF433 family)